MKFNRMYSNPVEKSTGVKYDQIGKLETYYPSRDNPAKLRRIKYYDPETKKEFIFLTNYDYKNVKERNNSQLKISGF